MSITRADQHMVEKIDLKNKVDLTGSLESDRLDRYITNLLEGLREEMGVKEKSDCECYLIENREKIIHDEAIIEKFYFFHNASERRIVYVVYRLLSESEDAGDSMTTDSVADSEADSEADSKADSEADSEGDESENEFSAGLPQPGDCDLFYVNRDALFPSHMDNELFVRFLKRNMDLQLLAKAPDDHLFVLLGPAEKSVNPSTKFLCVLWVSLEGPTFQQSVFQPYGDMIYYLFPNQFVEQVIPLLSGANIKRVLVRPSANGMDYDSAAVKLLSRYFEGQFTQLSEVKIEDALVTPQFGVTEAAQEFSLVEENVTRRTDCPPLLVPLREKQPERLHYLSGWFDLCLDHFCFWKKLKFVPLFIGLNPCIVTGKYSCIVLKALKNDDVEADGSNEWGFYGPFYQEFKQKLVKEMFGDTYRKMNYELAMSVLDPKINFVKEEPASPSSEFLHFSADGLTFLSSKEEYGLTVHAIKKLGYYSLHKIEYTLIKHVAVALAKIYFLELLPVSLSQSEASILFCYGLQGKEISEIEREMNLKTERILDYLLEVMQRFYEYIENAKSKPKDDPVGACLKRARENASWLA
ncbi:hypothetical protein R3W88_013210 [Solanum pinnatisectum]|uniref:Uncharacterized protein n=1 Tax=Solanum pinnatisectum TaxID=50273 RepID=A0AAV9LB92_9SOLN|nr:hypothetical protein R3W88_013210 [Solanum pinnatisectum]